VKTIKDKNRNGRYRPQSRYGCQREQASASFDVLQLASASNPMPMMLHRFSLGHFPMSQRVAEQTPDDHHEWYLLGSGLIEIWTVSGAELRGSSCAVLGIAAYWSQPRECLSDSSKILNLRKS
jgi:hypothetical protein